MAVGENALVSALGLLFKAHPWHGISQGDSGFPMTVNAFIEVVPSDTIKYEIDKRSGHVRVDRPQQLSNLSPTLYGFVPRTYCGQRVAEWASDRIGDVDLQGDEDPLDICVLSEREIAHGDVLLEAIPVGGLRVVDGGEADDKIIAVLKDDAVYGEMKDLSDVPRGLIDRLRHYFMTYKQMPGASAVCEVVGEYGREEALEVVRRSHADYLELFSELDSIVASAMLITARSQASVPGLEDSKDGK